MNDEEENEEKNEKSNNVFSRMLTSKLSHSLFPAKNENENENNEQIVISENSLILKFDEFDRKKLKEYIFNTQMEYKTFKFKLRKGLLNIDNYSNFNVYTVSCNVFNFFNLIFPSIVYNDFNFTITS